MNIDQLRRSTRAELHAARCRDGDHSERRLWDDARELDARMTEAGYPPKHPTSWGTSPKNLERTAARSALRAANKGAVSPPQAESDPKYHLDRSEADCHAHTSKENPR